MATLGDLRLYAAEMAGWDVADAKGDRVINRWINQALQRLQSSHTWSHLYAYDRINLDVKVTGADLTATQDSRLLTFTNASVFLQKYVDEKWDFVISGEADHVFRIVEIVDAQNARTAEGQPWIEATSSSTSYEIMRTVYELPNDAKKILRVDDGAVRRAILWTNPATFDKLRQDNPGLDDGFPRYYTLRDDKIEFWPAPSSTRRQVALTYQRKATTYKTTDSDLTVVDWPDHMIDLLERAVELEASRGNQDPPVPYPIARAEYEECLMRYRAEDTDRAHQEGGMYPAMPAIEWPSGHPEIYRNPGAL